MLNVAVIGCGLRMAGMIGAMVKRHPGVRLAAVADPNEGRARACLQSAAVPCDHTRFFNNEDELLNESSSFHEVMIGTRCHQHTPSAVKVARTGLPLFLEKPVAISSEQLRDLRTAWRGREKQVVVPFPLRLSPVFRKARGYLASGHTGPINQIQAFNNPAYGDVYYATWYRRFEQTGGLWLQKGTHDFDYLNLLAGARPVRVAAMMTRRIFGTGRVLQPDASDFDNEGRGAPEAITDPNAALGDTGSRFHAAIRNQDAGSAIIWYENGVIASYDQNFAARREAGRRGAILTGYNGTVELNWHPRETVRFIHHHSDGTEDVDCPASDGHGGGDTALVQAFYDLLPGPFIMNYNDDATGMRYAPSLSLSHGRRTQG